MPYAALKPCSYPGCITLVKTGRCDAHQQKEIVYRDPEVQRLYNTRRWKRLRIMQLAKDPWCVDCLKDDIYIPAIDVDHITPHRGDVSLFFGGPLQSLCHIHHSRKTASEVFGKQNVS